MGKGSGKPSALKLLFYSGTILLLLAVATSFLGALTGAINFNAASIAFSICFSLLLSFLVVSYLLLKGRKPKMILAELGLSRKALTLRNVIYGIVLFLVYLGILVGIALFSQATGANVSSNVQQAIGSYPVWVLVFLSVIAPLNEEIAFRGFLVPRAGKAFCSALSWLAHMKLPPIKPSTLSWLGILLSALLFAALHFGYGSASEVVVALWFGLAAGYVFTKTKSLYPSLITHIAVNALTTITLAVFLHVL